MGKIDFQDNKSLILCFFGPSYQPQSHEDRRVGVVKF